MEPIAFARAQPPGQLWFVGMVAAFTFGRWTASIWAQRFKILHLSDQHQPMQVGTSSGQPYTMHIYLEADGMESMVALAIIIVLTIHVLLFKGETEVRSCQAFESKEAAEEPEAEEAAAWSEPAPSMPLPRRDPEHPASRSAPGNLQCSKEQSRQLRSCKSMSLLRTQSAAVAKVVIVDDDVLTQNVTQTLLQQEGFHVTSLASADQLLDMFQDITERELLPDIILLDICVSGISGIQATRALRMKWTPADLPIIIITPSQSSNLLTALKAGASDFINRPLRLEELRARINTQLALKRSFDFVVDANKSFSLLRSVFPAHVITQLKESQNVVDFHPCVTILFSDIKGYTEMASQWPTDKLVQMLNALFTAFDDVCERLGVYKVETIGDAYMIAAGADDGVEDHACRMMAVAEAMLRAAEAQQTHDAAGHVQIRIGVHTGPAYSGVVGKTRPRYCFFGDTVNTASRMESTGFSQAVQVSSATYQAVQDWQEMQSLAHGDTKWSFTSYLPRHIKGKGLMETHLLRVGAWQEALTSFALQDMPCQMEDNPMYETSKAGSPSSFVLSSFYPAWRDDPPVSRNETMGRASSGIPAPSQQGTHPGRVVPRTVSGPIRYAGTWDTPPVDDATCLRGLPTRFLSQSMRASEESPRDSSIQVLTGTPSIGGPRPLSGIMESGYTSLEEMAMGRPAAIHNTITEACTQGPPRQCAAVDETLQRGLLPCWPAVDRCSPALPVEASTSAGQLASASASRTARPENTDGCRTLKAKVSFRASPGLATALSRAYDSCSSTIRSPVQAVSISQLQKCERAALSTVSHVCSRRPMQQGSSTSVSQNHDSTDQACGGSSPSGNSPRVEEELLQLFSLATGS